MATILRYEVWYSSTGSVADWKLAPQGIYVGGSKDNESNKHRAIERAELMSVNNKRVCVEENDDGRNVYLRTIREFGNVQ